MKKCTYCQTPLAEKMMNGYRISIQNCDCMSNELARMESERKRIETESAVMRSGLNTGMYGQMRFDTWVSAPGLKNVESRIYRFLSECQATGTNWLFLHGKVGLGKTHLAVSVVRELAMERNWKPGLCRWAEFCTQIQQSWDAHSGVTVNWREIRNAKPLLIDDIDKRKATEWSIGQLFELIDYRYIHQLPTVITANHGLHELAGYWGKTDTADAVISRIIGQCIDVVAFAGKDYRLK